MIHSNPIYSEKHVLENSKQINDCSHLLSVFKHLYLENLTFHIKLDDVDVAAE